MSKERKRLERWTVFINPYCRLRRVVDRFREQLTELDLPNVSLPTMPRSEEEMKSFPDRMNTCIKTYTEALARKIRVF